MLPKKCNMEKRFVFDLISNIKITPDRQSFLLLKDYLSTIDPYLENKWNKKLKKQLEKIDNVWGELLCSLLKENSIDLEIFGDLEEKIEKKEIEESFYFNEQIMNVFDEFDYVYDLCAGNGLNGFYCLKKGKANFVHFYDKERNNSFNIVSNYLENNYQFHQVDIRKEEIEMEEDSLVTAIHACGDLTDKVIEIATSQGKPFAVVPCCHEKENYYFSQEIMDYFDNVEDVVDALRMKRAERKGYKILLRNIPGEVTRKNRIIIGKPSYEDNKKT